MRVIGSTFFVKVSKRHRLFVDDVVVDVLSPAQRLRLGDEGDELVDLGVRQVQRQTDGTCSDRRCSVVFLSRFFTFSTANLIGLS